MTTNDWSGPVRSLPPSSVPARHPRWQWICWVGHLTFFPVDEPDEYRQTLSIGGGANPLWLTEWLTEGLDLPSGMRVLDLGCGQPWERTGMLDNAVADTLPDGWQFWRDWIKLIAPANEKEIRVLETDAGRYFGYVRAVGHRRAAAQLSTRS